MRRRVLVLIAILAAAGCAREEAPRPVPPEPIARPAPPRPAGRAVSNADYVAIASSTDLFEIRSAELALTRTANPVLQRFAREMLSDHEGTAAQLSLAGRRLNLLPSSRLRSEHEAMMRELLATADFDRLYWRQQVTVHEQAFNLHRNYAAHGASPTLRPVAAAAVPIVRRHLDALRGMR